MIRRIEVKNYRSLKYIDHLLDDFHVLVGPNASGKTTFMDVVSFLADIVQSGIDDAIQNRSANYNDLTFSSKGLSPDRPAINKGIGVLACRGTGQGKGTPQ